MQWHGVNVETAKAMVKHTTHNYGETVLERIEEFKNTQARIPEKLDRHLRPLSYQVNGNIVHNCPRSPTHSVGSEFLA